MEPMFTQVILVDYLFLNWELIMYQIIKFYSSLKHAKMLYVVRKWSSQQDFKCKIIQKQHCLSSSFSAGKE